MKVLVIHSELGVLRGGGENFTRNLFIAFAERGHDVSAAFIADSRGSYPILLPSKIRPIPLAGYWSRKLGQDTLSRMAGWIPQGSELRTRWDRVQDAISWRTVRWHDRRFTRRIELEFDRRWKEFDAVYVHGSAVLASKIARYLPTVLRVPGPVPAEFAPVLKEAHVVCANGDALKQIQEFLGEHAVELPVGLNGDLFKPGPTLLRERLGWTRNHWVIGYVGRLAYVKGVDLLAVAFAQIRQLVPHARLLFVGCGEEEGKLRSQLHSELVEGIVHFEPDVPHDHLTQWYRAMDLFVMPSRYENYSNAVLEALACRVPFLVSDVGGNRHLAETLGGATFSLGSADSLAQQVVSLATNPYSARSSAKSGGDQVRRLYSWASSAKRLEDILLSCLDRKIGMVCRP
jgi:glycosyltransferase involved in cell wall biosynthesis